MKLAERIVLEVGKTPYEVIKNHAVYLDGKALGRCVYADSEAGIVRVRDQNGDIVERSGRVVIMWRRDASELFPDELPAQPAPTAWMSLLSCGGTQCMCAGCWKECPFYDKCINDPVPGWEYYEHRWPSGTVGVGKPEFRVKQDAAQQPGGEVRIYGDPGTKPAPFHFGGVLTEQDELHATAWRPIRDVDGGDGTIDVHAGMYRGACSRIPCSMCPYCSTNTGLKHDACGPDAHLCDDVYEARFLINSAGVNTPEIRRKHDVTINVTATKTAENLPPGLDPDVSFGKPQTETPEQARERAIGAAGSAIDYLAKTFTVLGEQFTKALEPIVEMMRKLLEMKPGDKQTIAAVLSEGGGGNCPHCSAWLPSSLVAQIASGTDDCPSCGWREGRCKYCNEPILKRYRAKDACALGHEQE